MHTSLVLYSTIFALSMERFHLTHIHCWLYNLCIVVYVTNKLELELELDAAPTTNPNHTQ